MFALIFGTTFAVTGVMCIWIARATFAKDRAIASWPRAPGVVTSSRIESRTRSYRGQDGYYRDYTVHEPVVHFTYTVDGRVLKGDRLSRVVMSSNRKPDISRYPAGAAVMVYYDPNNPQTAYLEVRRSGGAVILSVFGGLFILIGVLVPALVLFF